jgi:hypothetical protein
MKSKEFITEAPRDVFHFVGQSHNVPKPTGSYYKWRVDLSNGQHYFVRAGAHTNLEKFEQYFTRKWSAEMPGVEVINAERLERLSEDGVEEDWSEKYKHSINCSHPKGFSQKAHCAGKKKHNEDMSMEMTCPDCGMCQTHGNLNEIKKGQKDSNGFTKCWPGHHAAGTKKGKNGGQVRNCVPNESINEYDAGEHGFGPFKLYTGSVHGYDHVDTFKSLDAAIAEVEFLIDTTPKLITNYWKIIDGKGEQVWDQDPETMYDNMRSAGKIQFKKTDEDWNKVNHQDKTNGLSQKAVNAYRRENPGSKLKTAVTTKPSKLKPGSKDAKRRKSFCARMSGNKGPMKKPNGKPTPKALALRRWNCESIEDMRNLIEHAEQIIAQEKNKPLNESK